MGYTVQQEAARLARETILANAWDIIRRDVGSLPLGKQWTTFYHAKSLTVQNQKSGIMVKVTIDGDVFYDRRVNDGYRSEKLSGADMAEACAFAKQKILQHL